MLFCTITLLAPFVFLTHAQGQFGRRAGHTVTRADKELVISGGLKSGTDFVLAYEHRTYFIPLDQTWTNSTLNATNIDRKAPGLVCDALWLDQERNVLYMFGGQLSPDGGNRDNVPNSFGADRSPAIWALPLGDKIRSWSMAVGVDAAVKFPSDIFQPACGAYMTDNNGGFYIGGAISFWNTFNITDKMLHLNVPGLLHFDFATKQLTNSTNDGGYFASRYTGPNESYYQPGPMFDAPFGSNGVWISTGGRTAPNATDNENGAGFENLWIWDKATNTSHFQQTTGDIPPRYKPARLGDQSINQFCFFSAADGKRNTYEIFVYGFFENGSNNDTIYILSLPSFQWHKTEFQNYPRRVRMNCQSAGSNNQAIFSGGQNPETSPNPWNSTDEWGQGIAVFDMNRMEMKDRYDADAPAYAAPDLVGQRYDNGDRFPSSWASPEVKALFENWQPKLVAGKGPSARERYRIAVGVGVGVGAPAGLAIGYALWRMYITRVRDKWQKLSCPKQLVDADKATSTVTEVRTREEKNGFTSGGNQNNNTGDGSQYPGANILATWMFRSRIVLFYKTGGVFYTTREEKTGDQ